MRAELDMVGKGNDKHMVPGGDAVDGSSCSPCESERNGRAKIASTPSQRATASAIPVGGSPARSTSIGWRPVFTQVNRERGRG